MLCILVLALGRLVPPLEEWPIGRGPEAVISSRCVPLYCVYQLLRLGDVDCSVLKLIVHSEYRWRQYSVEQVAGIFESFKEQVDGFVVPNGVAR